VTNPRFNPDFPDRIFASFEPGELETHRALMQKVLAGLRRISD
jgi:hypothetical protein